MCSSPSISSVFVFINNAWLGMGRRDRLVLLFFILYLYTSGVDI